MSTVKDAEIGKLMADASLWSECPQCRGQWDTLTKVCEGCLNKGRVPLTKLDAEWIHGQPAMFRPLIGRYGRRVFSVVMQAGVAQQAFNVMLQSRPPQQVTQAIHVLAGIFNDVFNNARKYLDVNDELFKSCKEDVERLGMMAGEAGMRQETGRIILPS